MQQYKLLRFYLKLFRSFWISQICIKLAEENEVQKRRKKISLLLDISLCIDIYAYICIHIYIYLYIYICMYIRSVDRMSCYQLLYLTLGLSTPTNLVLSQMSTYEILEFGKKLEPFFSILKQVEILLCIGTRMLWSLHFHFL